MHIFVACVTDYYININLYCYLLIFVHQTKSEFSQNKNGSIILAFVKWYATILFLLFHAWELRHFH